MNTKKHFFTAQRHIYFAAIATRGNLIAYLGIDKLMKFPKSCCLAAPLTRLTGGFWVLLFLCAVQVHEEEN